MASATPISIAAPPEPLGMAAVLRIPVMRRLWYAQIVSVFGDFVALFAVISILTFRLHGTPRQITGVQIAAMLPIAILGILAGVFVDRWPLKPTMVASDLLRALLVLALLVSTRSWHFYAVLAGISVVSSFFGPAQGVAIRAAVPLHGLRSANALIQQVMFGMRIIGPAAAAFLVASVGPFSCYLLDAASFVASAALIASTALVRPEARRDAAPSSTAAKYTGLRRVWTDMKQGIGFIVHHAALLFTILALASGMFVVGCFGPLIAVYVRDNVHASTRFFGVSSAMIGLGMMAGVNILNRAAKNAKNTTLVYSGLGGIALGLCLLTAFPLLAITILANLIIGFAVAGIIITFINMIQQETPQALMGRVGSTVMSTIFAAQITGLVLSGLLTQYMGVRRVFALCAVLLIVLVAAGKLFMEPKEQAASV